METQQGLQALPLTVDHMDIKDAMWIEIFNPFLVFQSHS
jgi:hypothetical protein